MMTLLPFLDTRHHAKSSCAPLDDLTQQSSGGEPLSEDPTESTELGKQTTTKSQQQEQIHSPRNGGFNYPPLAGGNGTHSAMTRSTSDCSAQSSSSSASKRRVIFPHHQNSDQSPGAESHESIPNSNPKTLCECPSSIESFSSREQENPAADLSVPVISSVPVTSSPAMRPTKGQRLIFPPAQQKMSNQLSASGSVPLASILRSPSKFGMTTEEAATKSEATAREPVDKIPSVESDIPSLATTISQSSLDDSTAVQDGSNRARAVAAAGKPNKASRSLSVPVTETEAKRISFDPRVWVREFTRCVEEEEATWYTSKDLETFKREAIQLIMDCSETELVPTGTGRFIPRKVVPQGKAFFSHRALRMDTEEEVVQSEKIAQNLSRIQALKAREIQRILIVDPHDICVKLFAKSFKNVLPHVVTVGVSSGEEALERCKSMSFDLVLVEERLRLFHSQSRPSSINSGASLIRELKTKNKEALFIGVSTRLREDAPKLKVGGADMCWPKPPPKIEGEVTTTLLRMLLERRGRSDLLRKTAGGCG